MLGLLRRTCPLLTDCDVRRTLYLSLAKLLLLLLMIYYKIVTLDESELRNYLQTLVKNIKSTLCYRHYITTIVY